jgi:hypothetical protein
VLRSAGRQAGLAMRLTGVDVSVGLLVLTGSLLPLGWMLLRGRHIAHDDALYSLVLWKYLAIFLIFRLTITNDREVHRCLWIVLATSAVVAVIGILQVQGWFGVPELLNRYFSPLGEIGSIDTSRASSTLGSTFAVGDVMTYSFAITAGLLVAGDRRRLTLAALAALFILGGVASAEFSTAIGLAVAMLAFGFVTRRLGRTLLAGGAAAVAAGVALEPVIQARISAFDTTSGLPPSWAGRYIDLKTYFWPPLGHDYNWLTGVRLSARVPTTHRTGGWIWIESGHTWLLWTGGVAFLLAFLVFLAVSLGATARIARLRPDAIGVAATASFTALSVMAVLMVLDPHLTLRGAADLSFALLALALSGSRVTQRRLDSTPVRKNASSGDRHHR